MVHAAPPTLLTADADAPEQRPGGYQSVSRGSGDLVPVDPWTRASQVAIIGLFAIALLWCAQVSGPVLIPVLLAWVVSTILLPIVRRLQDWNMPRALAAILLTAALVVIVISLLLLLATPITYWLGRAAELGALLREKLQLLSRPLALIDEARRTLSTIGTGEAGALKVETPPANMVTATLSVLTPAISGLLLFVVALLFQLIYQERMRTTLVILFHTRTARLQALRTLKCIDESMTTYFSTYTLVNVCLGTVTFALAWLVGLPNPLLWGILAGTLNYVPYVGPAVVAATLAAVGLLTFPSLVGAALAPLVYIAIVTVEGQFLTPYLMGRRLELNPFAVFLSIAFCTWLWGPVGAFLAVPMLMVATVSIEHAFAEAKPELPN
jgi:predicted PurR-regulated permease PerM